MAHFSSVVLSILVIVLIVWLVVLVISLISLYRRRDLPTFLKWFWTAVIFFAPLVGLVLYLIYGTRRNHL